MSRVALLAGNGLGWGVAAVRQALRRMDVAVLGYQPPRRTGSAWDDLLRQSAVVDTLGRAAAQAGVPTRVHDSANGEEFRELLSRLQVQHVVCVGYGEILGPELLECGRTFLNFHPSLLPLHRGSNPISSVLYRGEAQTGITVHRMSSRIDVGDVVLQGRVPVVPADTFGTLSFRLSELGRSLMDRLADCVGAGELQCEPCPDPLTGFYVRRPPPEFYELRLETDPLDEMDRKVRAYGELDATFFTLGGRRVYAGGAQLVPAAGGDDGAPRRVMAGYRRSVLVSEGGQVLRLFDLRERLTPDFGNELLLQRVLAETLA
jgi:methionyl-tRNA formyltransferase